MAISELDLHTGVVAHSLADAKRMAEVMADGVAKVLDYAVHTHGIASLAVSGGRSPIPFFEALSRRELDWSRVQITLADERWVPPSDEASNEALVRRYLLQGPAAQAQARELRHGAGARKRNALGQDVPCGCCAACGTKLAAAGL